MDSDTVYYELLELNRIIESCWTEFMIKDEVGVVLSDYINRTPPRIVLYFDPIRWKGRIKRSEKSIARDAAKRFIDSIIPDDFKYEVEEERNGEIIYTITARESITAS
jgi:hypothetical protein